MIDSMDVNSEADILECASLLCINSSLLMVVKEYFMRLKITL